MGLYRSRTFPLSFAHAMTFRDLKIGVKQGLGFSLILVLMACVSTFSVMQVSKIREEIDALNANWLPRVVAISSLNLNAAALRIYQLQHAFTTEAPQEQALVDAMLNRIDAVNAQKDAYEALKNAFATAPRYAAREDSLYAAFDAGWDAYQAEFLSLLSLSETGAKRAAIDRLNGPAGEIFDAFSANLEALVELDRQAAADAVRRAEATYVATRQIISALFVGTILLSALLAFVLVRFITVPVHQLERAAESIARGNLRVRVRRHARDEIGSLAESFNQMTVSLRHATEQMQQQAATLQAQQETLQRTNRELEEKSRSLQHQKAEVEEKHRDLAAALRQLEEAQQQLVVKEKLASLGQLTAGIAHEIKNPLNFVNNFAALSTELVDEIGAFLHEHADRPVAELLDDLEDLLDDLRTSATKINEHGRRADGIVRSMLLHSRGKAGERQPTDLNTLVDEYVSLAYHGMRATEPGFNVALTRTYDASVGTVVLVPQEIGRVLLNLLNNAFHAVQEQARAQTGSYQPRVTVCTERRDDEVVICVEDNGAGIPESLHAKIFEPFFTTKPTGSGTGLGLSLSYEIVTRSHNGTLTFESTEGAGTTFVVTLPAALTPGPAC